jgi:hypothetical protein
MNRSAQGRALFHTRDSGGKHETTPGEYVKWGAKRARELGLLFSGTPEQIELMIAQGASVSGDIFLDYEVPGNELSRPALNAMIEEIANDPTVSHVMIPRRDRLARPTNPLDGVRLERELRLMGVHIVFMDRELGPLRRGEAANIGEDIEAYVGYSRADRDVRDLSEKMIYSQLALSGLGYTSGGRANYGFARYLARGDGTAVRKLEDGEYVKRAHHHVVKLPDNEEHLAVVRRIYEMLDDMTSARKIAATFTEEGILTPDAGRERTDNGQKHETSGVWQQTTVVELARNPIYKGERRYGRRSMGRLHRQTPDGPRILEDDDFRADGKPKVIRNPISLQTTCAATFPPVVDVEQWDRVNRILDERGKSQRGVPRSRCPDQNPLGGRVYDMACCWPMYRTPYKDTFKYQCGLYMQSHGQTCAHNTVIGPQATTFVLSAIQSQVLSQPLMKKIGDRLREIAAAETVAVPAANVLAQNESVCALSKPILKRRPRTWPSPTPPNISGRSAGSTTNFGKRRRTSSWS